MNIENILSKMSLKEKIEQLNQLFLTKENIDEIKERLKGECLGSLIIATNATAGNSDPENFDIETVNELQKIAMESHGIPLLFGKDVIHGHHISLPVPLGLSATFNPDLVKEGYRNIAEEAVNSGINWSFAPMLDLSRDPRWGRIVEGPGEDPYLGAKMGEAIIKGFQGDGEKINIAACAKHYIGYGASEGGRDYQRAEISPYSLQNYYLPAFRGAVNAGVATVMNSFNEISGEPVASSRYLLTDVLRGQLGFDGFVISDWGAIDQLIRQGVAKDRRAAAELAINAGIDMDMTSDCYADNLENLMNDGKVTIETIDTAVRRILSVKERMNLFEEPYLKKVTYSVQKHRKTARLVEEESIVMLKNDGVLPLNNQNSVCVTGEISLDRRNVLGTWTCDYDIDETVTIFDGIKNLCSNAFYHEYPLGIDRSNVSCDAVIVVLGEDFRYTGEGNSITKLEIDERQKSLIKWAKHTRKKVIGILAFGRLRALGDVIDDFDAVLYAWHGGSQIGSAVANIVFGNVSPSGKLPVSIPRCTGQIPLFYNFPPSARDNDGYYDDKQTNYWDESGTPLFPFGFGLSYADFSYSSPTADKKEISLEQLKNNDCFTISVAVKNVGSVTAKETVQCYIRDCLASMTRPLKELKGFEKIELKSGEEQEVKFRIGWSDLGFYKPDGTYIVEKGNFKIYIGSDCLTQEFTEVNVI